MKRIVIMLTSVVAGALLAAGCGTTAHQASFDNDYTPPPGTSIEVGEVTNGTGHEFESKVTAELRHALADELAKQGLLYVGGERGKLILVTRIVEFKKGSTWRRHLYPGWGEAILAIRCDLKDGGRVVGGVQARRSFKYANPKAIIWRNLFEVLAEDVAKDLRAKIRP